MKAIKVLLSATIIFCSLALLSCGSASSSGEIYEKENTFYSLEQKIDFLEEWVVNALNQREISGSEEELYTQAAQKAYEEIKKDLKNKYITPDEKKRLDGVVQEAIKNQILEKENVNELND
ncbi:MAG TPA: hypothetical protein PK720_02280 [bacterium]|nr:hypothetical protein [bacterium]